jgi:putative FmdB family regulatory protein
LPIYEYRCRDCGKKSSYLTLSVKSKFDPRCKKCGGANLEKLVSRVAVSRSDESRMDSLADPSSLAGLDEKDPQSIARWIKKMGKEVGEDIGEDFDQSVDEAVEEAQGADAEGEGSSDGDTDF